MRLAFFVVSFFSFSFFFKIMTQFPTHDLIYLSFTTFLAGLAYELQSMDHFLFWNYLVFTSHPVFY